MARGHQCGPGDLPRSPADRRLAVGAGSGHRAELLAATGRRHGVHYRRGEGLEGKFGYRAVMPNPENWVGTQA